MALTFSMFAEVSAQPREFDTYDELEKYLSTKESVVVNYWATWCGPCVKELPYFSQLSGEMKGMDWVLVSLDFPKMIDRKLLPFIEKNDLGKCEVVVLDGPEVPHLDRQGE